MKALAEAHRLLKSGGSLLFMEHGYLPNLIFKNGKIELHHFGKKLVVVATLIEILRHYSSSGFKFKDLKKKYIKGPKIASFLYYGEAPKV